MFGTYMEGLRQAEDLMEKGKHEEALYQINLLEKGVELDEIEKLACMLLTSQIMNRIGHYEKSLMLSKAAFRKSMELSEPLLVVDSTITFLESMSGLGMLFNATKKEHKEFMFMIETSEEIIKTIDKLKKKEREVRTENLINLKGIIKHAQTKVIPIQKDEPKKELVVIPGEKIKGVGQKASDMKKAGLKTVADVAYASVDDLVKIKGIGQATATKFIEAAKELLKE